MSTKTNGKPLVTDEETRAKIIEACAALMAAQWAIAKVAGLSTIGRVHDVEVEFGTGRGESHQYDSYVYEHRGLEQLQDFAHGLVESLLREPGYVSEADDDAYVKEPLRVEIENRALEIQADILEAVGTAVTSPHVRMATILRASAAQNRKAGVAW